MGRANRSRQFALNNHVCPHSADTNSFLTILGNYLPMTSFLNVNELLRVLQKSNLTNDSSFEPPRQADQAKTIDIPHKIQCPII